MTISDPLDADSSREKAFDTVALGFELVKAAVCLSLDLSKPLVGAAAFFSASIFCIIRSAKEPPVEAVAPVADAALAVVVDVVGDVFGLAAADVRLGDAFADSGVAVPLTFGGVVVPPTFGGVAVPPIFGGVAVPPTFGGVTAPPTFGGVAVPLTFGGVALPATVAFATEAAPTFGGVAAPPYFEGTDSAFDKLPDGFTVTPATGFAPYGLVVFGAIGCRG